MNSNEMGLSANGIVLAVHWNYIGSVLEELFDANKRYSETFTSAGVVGKAAKQLGVVTCMDTRIDPLSILGLALGDAKIMRNAGGRVTQDVIRSLVFATMYLDVTQIVIMHHTRCAMTSVRDDDVRDQLASAGLDAGNLEFLTMADPDRALAEDVERVLTSRALPKGIKVEGWRYDVDCGKVIRVVG